MCPSSCRLGQSHFSLSVLLIPLNNQQTCHSIILDFHIPFKGHQVLESSLIWHKNYLSFPALALHPCNLKSTKLTLTALTLQYSGVCIFPLVSLMAKDIVQLFKFKENYISSAVLNKLCLFLQIIFQYLYLLNVLGQN